MSESVTESESVIESVPESLPASATDRAASALAVISDGSAAGHTDGSSRAALAVSLERDAQIVGGLGGFRAEPMLKPHDKRATRSPAQALIDTLAELPDRFGAAFLTRADPAVANTVAEVCAQREMRLVLTEQDAVAAALSAQVLAYLASIDRSQDDARIIVAGPNVLPSLSSLLITLGVFDLTAWRDDDAARFPLERIARDADVIIDVRHDARARSAGLTQDRPEGSVLRPNTLEALSWVAPAVCRVALACPPGSTQVSVDMLRMCALAIAQSSGRRPWPILGTDDGRIVDAVATAIRRTIDPRLHTSR